MDTFNSLHFNLSVSVCLPCLTKRKYKDKTMSMSSFHIIKYECVAVIEALEVSPHWHMNKQGGCGSASDYRKFDYASMNSAYLSKSKGIILEDRWFCDNKLFVFIYISPAMSWQRVQGVARLSPEGSMNWYTDWHKITHIHFAQFKRQ